MLKENNLISIFIQVLKTTIEHMVFLRAAHVGPRASTTPHAVMAAHVVRSRAFPRLYTFAVINRALLCTAHALALAA
jgi:hypothetical protein